MIQELTLFLDNSTHQVYSSQQVYATREVYSSQVSLL